jgi:OmpA family
MRMSSLGCFAGALGLLLGAGSVWADEQPISGHDIVNQMAGKPECRDAGVTVSFATGSVELDTNARGALNGVATWMKTDSQRTLHLRGYSDVTGNSEANLVLSENRANAVKDYLVSQGVDATQIMTVGRGEDVADQLPANGRTVTFLACQPPAPMAQAETPAPAPAAEAPAAPPPAETPPPPPVVFAVPATVEPVSVPVETQPAPKYEPPSKFGLALMAGGGYQDFASSNMRDRTNGGGAWDVRFIAGMRSVIGFEGAYVGSARGFQSLGVTANNPTLISNGIEGNLRLNVPIIRGDSLIEPYGVVGVGWSQYHITNFNSNTQALSDFNATNDNVLTVPFGVGFTYGYKALLLDVRGSYSATYYNNLLGGTNGSGTLNTWGVGGQVGFMF